jgi:hypothetical protein
MTSGSCVAAVDDLHVVDGEDREAVGLGVEVRPGLEVADHELGAEVADEVEIGLDVLGGAGEAREDVGPEGLSAADAVLLVDHVQAVDAVGPLEALAEEVARAAGGHDLDLVALSDEALEHDARAHRVAHAFAHDTVEDLHAAKDKRRGRGGLPFRIGEG